MGNCCGKVTPSTPSAEYSEALVLVVGNDTEHKSRVARDLAEARGAAEERVNNAGVRVFARRSFPEVPVVMDTTALRTVGASRVDTARVWVSQNSLRRLSGQEVFVVCVIGSTDPTDQIFMDPRFEHNEFSWLHVLACVFEKQRREIMILVNADDSTDDVCKQNLRRVLARDGFKWEQNITFVNPSMRGGYLRTPMIKTVLQSSVARSNGARSNGNDEATIENRSGPMSPFRLPKIESNAGDAGTYGPWGPENVILFGKSGSGKSTLARMLTSGEVDATDCVSRKFSTSSSLRGETKDVINGQGRGWRVIDTPGLGEPNDDEKSGVSTDRAGKLIKDHIMLVQGIYSHFIFVVQKDRVSVTDTSLWEIFNKMFSAEGIEKHMTVVVSGADQDWLNQNVSYLKTCFKGCDSFLAAEFPSVESDDDDEVRNEKQSIRRESLTALEEGLASLCRLDTTCRLGMWSIGTQRSLFARSEDELMTVGSHMRGNQTFALGPSACHPQPSDYETARGIIRLKALTTTTFLAGHKLDVKPTNSLRGNYLKPTRRQRR